jgi:uncharacterized protein
MNFDEHNSPPSDPAQSPVPWEIIESQPLEKPAPVGATSNPAQDSGPAGVPLPEDLRVPWGWTDLLLLVILYIAGSIVVSVPVLIGFLLAGVSRAELSHSPGVQGLFVIVNQALLSVSVLAYLFAEMRLRYRSPFWRTIGWRPLETHHASRGLAYLSIFAGGFLFSLLIQFASAAFGTKAKLPIETLLQDQRNAILFMLMAVTIAPVLEETIFRGYIYPVLARSFGVGAGIVVTGTLFGLLHALQLWGGWIQIGLMVIVGIFFTYVRSVTRTVVASYLLHLSYNSVPLLVYIIASHGFHRLPVGP